MVSPMAKAERNGSPNYMVPAYPAASLTRLGLYDSNGGVRGDCAISPRSKNISFFVPLETLPDVVPLDLKLHKGHSQSQKPKAQSRSRSRSSTPLATDGPGIETRSQSRSRSRSASPSRVASKPKTKAKPELTRRSRSRSVSPAREAAHDGLKTAERKTHKCRGRTESIAWFEVGSLTRWASPPSAANELNELEDGDLLINWLDFATMQCQIWRFIQKEPQGSGQWRALRWGAKFDQQDFHRLVITEKGLPSFVAESTWKKKYKPQSSKIVT